MSMLLLISLAIDQIIGDPRNIPHPVVLIGKLINVLERGVRAFARTNHWLKLGGLLLVIVVCLSSFASTWGVIWLASKVHPYLGLVIHIWLLATTLAVKSLYQHAIAVAEPLLKMDLPTARAKLSLIVGRDTETLGEQEITRATVETVAENTVDGIVSPLFYAAIGGAPLAMAYKAINTMDSMIGHKDEQYLHLGWAAARLDDLANYLPARLAGLFYIVLSPLTPGGLKNTVRTILVDAQKHPSPNSGIPEAAVAGALGVQLGGTNYYRGEISCRPLLGLELNKLTPHHIYKALNLTYGVTLLTVVAAVAVLTICNLN